MPWYIVNTLNHLRAKGLDMMNSRNHAANYADELTAFVKICFSQMQPFHVAHPAEIQACPTLHQHSTK